MWISRTGFQNFQLLQEHLCNLSFRNTFYDLFWLFIKDEICNRILLMSREGQKCNLWFFLQLQRSEVTQETLGICCWGKLPSTEEQGRNSSGTHSLYPVWAIPSHLWWVPCLLWSLKVTRFAACRCDRNSQQPWCQGTSHPPCTGAVPCRQGFIPWILQKIILTSLPLPWGIFPRRKVGF